MLLLAIETSCDETSAAVVRDGVVLSNIVASQLQLHAEYGGVVPELAAREHLRNLSPVIGSALTTAQIQPHQLDAVAATQGPGLPNALMIGLKSAQAIAFAIEKPFLGIHHHEAHLYSPWIVGDPPRADFASFERCVSLIVSGGHTLLVHLTHEGKHQVLGSTIDDAAGECFDKTAKLMGLPYPGGPAMDRLAREGNPLAHNFPRPMINDPSHDFSFSGLKTSVRYFVRDHPEVLENPSALRDLCASVQAAIVEVLVFKTVRAARRLGVGCIAAAGGVTCNSRLRADLARACEREGLRLRLAEPALCTDNAAMIGVLAERKFGRGVAPTALDDEIRTSWELG
jgi:N6-L-threonylcarbamoyladenine synthase